MTKVYLVSTGEFSDYAIAGIFSTRELAEAHAAELARAPGPNAEVNDVEEYELDGEAGKVATRAWVAGIYLESGDGMFRAHERVEMLAPGRDCDVRYGCGFRGAHWVEVKSAVSAEHALKVAAEKRQAWLRERGIGLPS